MSRFLKFLKWAAIVLFGVPVLIYLVWLTGNIQEDKLSPELAALLANHPAQINENDNAYFDTLGLAAPSNIEPHAWGVSLFTQASANDRAVLEGKSPIPIKLDGYPIKLPSVILPCWNKETSTVACLEEVASDTASVQKHLKMESLLLQRFDAMLEKKYQEPYRERSAQSDFLLTAEGRASKLALIRIAMEINQGHEEMAITRWRNETTFILRQAKNSHNMVDKTILIRLLRRYQVLLAEYLSLHPSSARTQAKQLLALLEPFNKSAVTFQFAFADEALVTTRTLLSRQMDSYGFGSTIPEKLLWKMSSPLYDRHATANEFTKRNIEWNRIAAFEGNDYRTAIAKISIAAQNPLSAIFSFHNPVGQYFDTEGSDFVTHFKLSLLFKSDSILANKQLLDFAIDLVSRNITSSEQIASEIKANQADLKHPYTGQFPVWDAQKSTLQYAVPEEFQGWSPEEWVYIPFLIKL